MRIALLAPFALHPKSSTRWRALPLARALVAAGHAVRLVVPPYDWPAHSGRCWRDGGVDIWHAALPAERLPAPLGRTLLAGRLLHGALSWRPDVVHCFKPKGYSGLAAWLLAQMGPRRPPLVVDVDDWERGWNAAAGYPPLWRLFFNWQERWGLRQAEAVTAASRWLQSRAGAARGAAAGVFYLPNGSEPGPSVVAAPGHSRRVLLYTRFVEHSPEQIWGVWQRILAEAPDARLLVAGKGLRGEERRLAELAGRSGASSVRLLGWLPAATRAGLFAASGVGLLPVTDTPRNRAKSPMRLVDLLAAGVAVATQAVGEYALYVQDGETGLLASAGDDGALAAAALRLLRDDGLRGRLGAAAARHMQKEYAWSRLAETALAAYREAV